MTTAELPQHMQALARANEVRYARVELMRGVKAGTVDVAGLLAEGPPPFLDTMLVEALLKVIWRLPRRTVHSMLHLSDIRPTRRVGELTERQRLVLARQVRDWMQKRKKEKR